jgi:cathepsin L
MTKHNKVYSSEAEKAHRFKVFSKNAAIVAAHNLEADKGTYTFRLDTNVLADMTNAEYRAKMLRYRPGSRSAAAQAFAVKQEPTQATLPPSVDWRTKGAVNAVKDQGQCGSCWAFSATAAMETAWFIKTGKLLSLSEQMCVDCVNGGADDCNTGGEMHDCYLQVIKQGGDELESDYPYTATSGHGCKYSTAKSVTKFASYVNVTQYDEVALATMAVKSVVSVAIDASSIWFQLYSSGVYNQADCKYKWNDLDHGVAVVGYGSLSGDNYWTVRNSWGGLWGMQGYILMSKDKSNQCGIATDATVPNPAT